jgi:hypothetical protein
MAKIWRTAEATKNKGHKKEGTLPFLCKEATLNL